MAAARTRKEVSVAALPLAEDEELSLPVSRLPTAPPMNPTPTVVRVPRGVAVHDVMTYPVYTVRPSDTVFEAVARMIQMQVSGLPVVSGRRLVGVITQNDVGRVLAERTHLTPLGTVLEIATARAADDPSGPLGRHALELRNLRVRAAMTPDPVSITATETVGVAVDRMESEQVKRLPVLDARGRLVGIVTRRDLLRSLEEGRRVPRPPAD